MTLVVGTAGHIDHGKTTLLRALTGIDADRLPEEQRRGMTIDVGYAHMTLPDGRVIDFVDVPGHDRLIGNMLVGAGEVDAVLLVVAADDGPRAQTIEHLDLIDALGHDRAVVAITKVDLVDPGRVSAVEGQVRKLLDATRLRGAPLVRVSATTGEGLEPLTAELASLEALPDDLDADPAGPAILAIDRVFTIKGRGVVVTGTLRGVVRRGDSLRLIPGDRDVVARDVQVHGAAVKATRHGRTALNLRGVDAAEVHRGMVVTSDPRVVASDRLLVALQPPAAFGGRARALPPDRARVRVHIGTDQAEARIGRAGRESITFGDGRATALLRLDRPIAAAPGDRFVLRRPATHMTDGGGLLLDVSPPVGVARRRATRDRLAALLAARSPAERASALVDLHGIRLDGRASVLAEDLAEGLRAETIDRVGRHHVDQPAQHGVPVADLRAHLGATLRRSVAAEGRLVAEAVESTIDRLIAAGALVADGDRVRLPEHRAVVDTRLMEAMNRLASILSVANPPGLRAAMAVANCPVEGVASLERRGRIVRLDDDLAWSAEMYWELARRALRLAGGGPLTPAAFRDETGTSRKYVMAILEDLDRRAILRRTPAGHVPGPRAGTLDGEAATVSPISG